MEKKNFEEQKLIKVPFKELFGKTKLRDIVEVYNKYGITDFRLIPNLKSRINNDILELKTDNFGKVVDTDDLFQIKVFDIIGEGKKKLLGTITFFRDDINGTGEYSYEGIVTEKNSGMLLDVFYKSGISTFSIDHDKGIHVDILDTDENPIDDEQYDELDDLISLNPGYNKLRIVDIGD